MRHGEDESSDGSWKEEDDEDEDEDGGVLTRAIANCPSPV